MERILYIWAIRHPASGYVQGINDLLTPLYVVFLSAHVGETLCTSELNTAWCCTTDSLKLRCTPYVTSPAVSTACVCQDSMQTLM